MSDSDSDDEKDSDDKSDDGKSSGTESDDKQEQKTKGFSKGAGGEDFDGIEAMTDTNYQKKQYDAVDQNATEIEHLNIPKVNLKEVIVDYKVVNDDLTKHYKERCKGTPSNEKFMKWVQKDIVKISRKNRHKSTISYMVKEFEMRKAADLYKRSTVCKNRYFKYGYITQLFL